MATEHVTSDTTENRNPPATPLAWSWILQRFTGIVLLVFLGGHLWAEHAMNTSVHVVTARLRSGIYMVLDTGLLVTVVYHGLNGLYRILKETLAVARMRWFVYLMGVFGLLTVVWGLDILWAFVYHRPFLVIG